MTRKPVNPRAQSDRNALSLLYNSDAFRASTNALAVRAALKLNLVRKNFSGSEGISDSLPFDLAILQPFRGHFPLWR